MIRYYQSLDFASPDAPHLDMLRPTDDLEAERLEYPHHFPAAENSKPSPHMLTGTPRNS